MKTKAETKFPGFTTLSVVADNRVEYMTESGWQLLAIVTDDTIEGYVGSEPAHYKSDSGYNEDRTVETKHGHIVRHTMFVMGKDDESELAKMRAQLKAGADDVKVASDEKTVAEKQRDESKARELTTHDTMEFYQKQTKVLHKELEQDHEKQLQLEADLAKVRQAIGDTRYDKILHGEDV